MADDNKKRSFDVDGKKYAVRVPTVDEIRGANEMRAKTFNEALSRGDLLRDQLEGELRNRKLWNDQRENEYQTLRQEVLNGEFTLQKGGIKLSQARALAVEMGEKRNRMVNLLSSRTDLDSNTCEGRADAARFNYLFASCLVYDDTEAQYFPKGLDDYLVNQDDPVALAGASEFYYLISGSDSVDNKLPENKFLKKFKFVDSKGRFIDKEGRLIATDGKHIDEDGNYIKWNEDGTSSKIDNLGRAVREDGDFAVEHSAFLDDDGSPIDESGFEEETQEVETEEVAEDVEETEVAEEAKPKSKPKAKRARKKAVTTKSETSDEVVQETES